MKTYVDNKVTASTRPPIAWDPNDGTTTGTNGYPLPSTGASGQLAKGDQFIVTTAG